MMLVTLNGYGLAGQLRASIRNVSSVSGRPVISALPEVMYRQKVAQLSTGPVAPIAGKLPKSSNRKSPDIPEW